MSVSDLSAATRRLLSKLLGRSRNVALAATLVPLGAVGMSSALAAPSVSLPPEFQIVPFSMRVTDMERIVGDAEGDAFRIELQVLNWAQSTAHMISMATNTGNTAVDGVAPYIAGASVDVDGRGGGPGGSDIGTGIFDPVAMHSGLGRGDANFRENEWIVDDFSESSVRWSVYDTSDVGAFAVGSGIPDKDLLGPFAHFSMIPGIGVDALGDTAIDGGPQPYSPPRQLPGGYPLNDADGFVIDVDDWDVNEVFSLNWFLASIYYHSAGYHPIDNPLLPLGTADQGNPFGFGVMNLVRIEPSIGELDVNLPGPVFVDNAGFDQSVFSFYDTVYEIPNPAEFAAEFGVGITAPFLNPADNIFDAGINTHLIPEPSSIFLVGSGILGVFGSSCIRRR